MTSTLGPKVTLPSPRSVGIDILGAAFAMLKVPEVMETGEEAIEPLPAMDRVALEAMNVVPE
jgi:hypothetical protein